MKSYLKFFIVICVCGFVTAFFIEAFPKAIVSNNDCFTIFENFDLRIDQISGNKHLAVSYVRNGTIYSTEDHYIYRKTQSPKKFVELKHFKKINSDIIGQTKDFIARHRIVRNIRNNFGANNIVVLKSNTILIFFDKIYRSVDHGKSFEIVYDFKKEGIIGPFNHGVAVDQNDRVYFGEYNTILQQHKIRILQGTQDGSKWSIFYDFSPGEIRHIHSIKYDKYRDILLIASGDTDEESKLMYIDKNREKVKILGSGDQGWRLISVIPIKNFLYWCSDNDSSGSYIYRYNFSNNKRKKLAFVGKPSYYSTQLKDGTLVFSTTFEPDSFYTNAFHPEPTVDLWVSKNGKKWYKALSYSVKVSEKKNGPKRPTIILPGGDSSAKHLFLTPHSTLNSNFSTKELKIIWMQ